MKKLIKILKAIAEIQRLRILALLSQKELCVCEIQQIIGLSFPTISKHLAILSDANILTSEKIQKWVIYSINWSGLDKETKSILKIVLKKLKTDKTIKEDLLKLSNLPIQRFCSPVNLEKNITLKESLNENQ